MTFYFHFIQSVLVISNRGRYRSLGSGRGQASSSRTRIYLKAYRKVVDIGDQTQYLWTRRQTPSLLSSPQYRIYTTHPELNLLSGPSNFSCESVGLKLMRPGTDSTDSECGEHGPHAGLVAGIISGVILVMALMALIIAIIHRKNKRGKWDIQLMCIIVTFN